MWSGILFLVSSAVAWAQLPLALDLFDEGDFAGCRRECRRILLENPREETARLLDAVAGLRLDPSDPRAGDTLGDLALRADDPETRCLAAYELGRLRWRQGDRTNAFDLLSRAFQSTRSAPLARRSGCSLYRLIREVPTLGNDHPALFQQLESSRASWSADVWRESHPRNLDSKGGFLTLLPRGFIAVYRSQIRPALGRRCSLVPSCSEFALQALRQHGLLGLPLAADRLIREPSVVSEAACPLLTEEGLRFADPLSDHDGWLRRKSGP